MTRQKKNSKSKNDTYEFKCILCGDRFEKEDQLFHHYQYECDGGF